MDIKHLKQLWKECGFDPRKALGQNFLIDNNVKNKIIGSLDLGKGATVVEIGPGFGMMTFGLAERCGRLIAVDKDARICGIMSDLCKDADNITLVNADILDVDICALAGGDGRLTVNGQPPEGVGKLTVYGNIPYNISTPIIERLIETRRCIDSVYMVIQEELAERIAASPGSKDFGSLTCFVQFYVGVKKLFRISRNCFYPRPKVDSCLLSLKMLDKPSVEVADERLMFRVIRKAFSQRRKKAVNPLSDGSFGRMDKEAWQKMFTSCGIDPASRAEALALSDYARLADAVKKALGSRESWGDTDMHGSITDKHG
jgi:16S rRNA (adenine1518-N6/adenine1519-N6)-dimethyltransferase